MDIELNPKTLTHLITMNSQIDANKMIEPTTFYPNKYIFQVLLSNIQSCLLTFYNCNFIANKPTMADIIRVGESTYQFHLTKGGSTLCVEKISQNGLSVINIL